MAARGGGIDIAGKASEKELNSSQQPEGMKTVSRAPKFIEMGPDRQERTATTVTEG